MAKKRIESLPLTYLPKESYDNVVNDNVYEKEFIDDEIKKIYAKISAIKPVIGTLIDDETNEETDIKLNF